MAKQKSMEMESAFDSQKQAPMAEVKKEVNGQPLKSNGKKAKVNMNLPGGSFLEIGKPVLLTDADEKHLQKHHAEKMHLIME